MIAKGFIIVIVISSLALFVIWTNQHGERQQATNTAQSFLAAQRFLEQSGTPALGAIRCRDAGEAFYVISHCDAATAVGFVRLACRNEDCILREE